MTDDRAPDGMQEARDADALPPLAGPPLAKLERASPGLRVLVFAKTKRHTRVPLHLIRGLVANGHHVCWLRSLRYRRLFGDAVASSYMKWRYRRYRPHLVLIYGRDVPEDVLRAMSGTPRLVYYEDTPKHLEEPGEEHLRIFRNSTILFTTARGMLPTLERHGVPRSSFLHGGCDPRDHHRVPFDARYRSDVAFIGRPSEPDRLALMRILCERFDTKLYGEGWKQALGIEPAMRSVYPRHYRKICASARIMIGIDVRHDVDLYFSNRTWLTLGCGGFLLTRYVPSLEEYFTNHRHLVWYRSAEECSELVRHYLANEEQRARIAAEGHRYVQEHHTFRHATAEMVRLASPHLAR